MIEHDSLKKKTMDCSIGGILFFPREFPVLLKRPFKPCEVFLAPIHVKIVFLVIQQSQWEK